MEIRQHEISIKDITKNYKNNDEEGVFGYGGALNIRPKYQREFIYKIEKQKKVIDSILKGFPLNVMYWIDNGNGTYELLDGQQRTMSICEYVANNFSIELPSASGNKNPVYYYNLTQTEKDKILNYKLQIYFCEGTDKEVLDWFNIINIATEPLTEQEMRNAVYTGEWLTDAKRYFSKNNCTAYKTANRYMKGECNRQEYLATVLSWIVDKQSRELDKKIEIVDYMSNHQHDSDAVELKNYFEKVIEWVQKTFINYRSKEMKGLSWGVLYNKYGGIEVDPKKLEERIKKLMEDEDIVNKKGIYEYVFDENEKHLNLREFSDSQKRSAFEKQNGICPYCKKEHPNEPEKYTYRLDEMHADHITPWSKGGKTDPENCQMLCAEHNRRKSDI